MVLRWYYCFCAEAHIVEDLQGNIENLFCGLSYKIEDHPTNKRLSSLRVKAEDKVWESNAQQAQMYAWGFADALQYVAEEKRVSV